MNFSGWLQEEISDRGWSQSETARRGQISQQTISRIINNQTQPTAVACQGIAKALNIPLTGVLERAGLPTPQADKSTIARFEQYLPLLSKESLDTLLHLARELSRRQ